MSKRVAINQPCRPLVTQTDTGAQCHAAEVGCTKPKEIFKLRKEKGYTLHFIGDIAAEMNDIFTAVLILQEAVKSNDAVYLRGGAVVSLSEPLYGFFIDKTETVLNAHHIL